MTHTDAPPTGAARRADVAEIASGRDAPLLEVVVPVYNEESVLERSVSRLDSYLAGTFPYRYRITVADNASVDGTPEIARRLAESLPAVTYQRLEQKGRGRALHAVWASSDAPVLAYVDVDLSTDLGALAPLVAPLISGHSDLAIGSRLCRGANVVRGTKREIVSRCYNLLLRGALAARFSDAQCGFKAIRGDVARSLLPMVADTGWFFDTELLVLAERAGLRIHEVPVDWVDDEDSRVAIVATALADLRGICRLIRDFATGGSAPSVPAARRAGNRERESAPPGLFRQLVRFAFVGALSTAAYLVLYTVFRSGTGAQAANFLALLLTAIGNTAANRRLTFAVRRAGGIARQQFEGLLVFALGAVLTSGSLWTIQHTGNPGRTTELLVLVAANLAASVLRFVLLRGWVFHPARSHNH